MHHSLLPNFERANLNKEYRIRVLIVFLFGLSLALVIGIVSLFPAFIGILLQERSELNTIDLLSVDKENGAITKIENQLAHDKALLDQFVASDDLVRLSSIIQSIVAEKGSMKITSISMERRAKGVIVTVLQGIAPDRDSLLAFKGRLVNLVPGSEVDLPISQLAKSTDIQFSLKLTEKIK